jgi:hypothetical protein
MPCYKGSTISTLLSGVEISRMAPLEKAIDTYPFKYPQRVTIVNDIRVNGELTPPVPSTCLVKISLELLAFSGKPCSFLQLTINRVSARTAKMIFFMLLIV